MTIFQTSKTKCHYFYLKMKIGSFCLLPHKDIALWDDNTKNLIAKTKLSCTQRNPQLSWSYFNKTHLALQGLPINIPAVPSAKAPWSFLYGNQIVLCQQKYESKTQMLHISAQCGRTPTDHILFFLFYWKLLKRIPTIFLHVRKLLSILAIQKWWIGGNCHFLWHFDVSVFLEFLRESYS